MSYGVRIALAKGYLLCKTKKVFHLLTRMKRDIYLKIAAQHDCNTYLQYLLKMAEHNDVMAYVIQYLTQRPHSTFKGRILV